MSETPLNPQITDAITQTNVKTLGEPPSEALSAIYQMPAYSTGMAMENAEQVEAAVPHIDDSATL